MVYIEGIELRGVRAYSWKYTQGFFSSKLHFTCGNCGAYNAKAKVKAGRIGSHRLVVGQCRKTSCLEINTFWNRRGFLKFY